MITIRELAKIAGVSPATVSKALNNQSDISEVMKEHIFALAKEYGYEKRSSGASNARRLSGMRVGIVFDDMYSNYYSRLVECFCDKIYQMNGVAILMDRMFSGERGMEFCMYMKKNRIVDGIIYIGDSCEGMAFEDIKIPIVTCQLGNRTGISPVDSLFIEVMPGLDVSVRLLLEQGHTSFAYLGEKKSAPTELLYHTLMAKYGIPEENQFFEVTDIRYEDAGYQLMERLFTYSRMPSAIICAYDNIATGAAISIRDHGFSVPEHFSLTGIDDSRLIIEKGRRVSSVDRKIQEQVDIVIALLHKRIRDPGTAVQNVKLLSGFSIGDTIGPRAAWKERPDEMRNGRAANSEGGGKS